MEQMIKEDRGEIRIDGEVPGTVAFVQCVGSRDPEKNEACSRFCCPTTIKQSIELKKRGTNVVVFLRDMRTVGTKAEEHYRKAREMGVRFLKFEHRLEGLLDAPQSSVTFRKGENRLDHGYLPGLLFLHLYHRRGHFEDGDLGIIKRHLDNLQHLPRG